MFSDPVLCSIGRTTSFLRRSQSGWLKGSLNAGIHTFSFSQCVHKPPAVLNDQERFMQRWQQQKSVTSFLKRELSCFGNCCHSDHRSCFSCLVNEIINILKQKLHLHIKWRVKKHFSLLKFQRQEMFWWALLRLTYLPEEFHTKRTVLYKIILLPGDIAPKHFPATGGRKTPPTISRGRITSFIPQIANSVKPVWILHITSLWGETEAIPLQCCSFVSPQEQCVPVAEGGCRWPEGYKQQIGLWVFRRSEHHSRAHGTCAIVPRLNKGNSTGQCIFLKRDKTKLHPNSLW